jgi:hypothetical protein
MVSSRNTVLVFRRVRRKLYAWRQRKAGMSSSQSKAASRCAVGCSLAGERGAADAERIQPDPIRNSVVAADAKEVEQQKR